MVVLFYFPVFEKLNTNALLFRKNQRMIFRLHYDKTFHRGQKRLTVNHFVC